MMRPFTAYPIDRSGTITAGGAAQDAMAANPDRRYLLIVNLHASETLWFNVDANAIVGSPSIPVAPNNGQFVMESSVIFCGRVSVNATSTGHAYIAKEA